MLWVHAKRHPGVVGLHDALRLISDLRALLKRLLADRNVDRGPRVLVVLLMLYLMSPIDLVPDFIPVIGYADDVLVVALVPRLVVRAAGPLALRRHWPGSDPGLQVIERLEACAGTPTPRAGRGEVTRSGEGRHLLLAAGAAVKA